MVRNRLIRSFMVLSLLAFPFLSQGQGKRQREYSGFFDSYYYRGPMSYTLTGGMTMTNGDLGKFYQSPVMRPAFGIGASYKLWPRTMFGVDFLYSQLAGKSSSHGVNLSFNTVNMELDAFARLYIIDDITRIAVDRRKRPKRIKPYLMSGIGILRYNSVPSITVDSLLLDSSSAAAIVTPSAGFRPVVPVGLGFSIFVTHRLSVITEFAYRIPFTDLLDGIIIAGDKSKDAYGCVTLKVQYSPTAPKRKKRKSIGTAPDQYNGPKGTETWKNKKPEKKKSRYEEEPPLETPPGENPPGETPPTETPPGETPPGDTPQENQLEEPAK
jgi:hypothetical protein